MNHFTENFGCKISGSYALIMKNLSPQNNKHNNYYFVAITDNYYNN